MQSLSRPLIQNHSTSCLVLACAIFVQSQTRPAGKGGESVGQKHSKKKVIEFQLVRVIITSMRLEDNLSDGP